MKESGLFPEFREWQEGYGAFTCSVKEKAMVINYIKNQKQHHRNENFENEYRKLLKEQGLEIE
ncbi:hypothetical protein [uncultured Chryseobacterium sp.]|uniref:hypothetical protein n=1 Tax=uncultured Chryseobacterium sp. TaxID=259322 RepID=UPI0025CD0F48|nr:hypothetical protein [uncultured Chryseobacterium sp.]